MSSRLLRLSEAAAASPVHWRSLGTPAASRQCIQEAQSEGVISVSAERMLEERVDAALRQGRTEGEAAGLVRARQQIEPVIARLNAAIGELAQQRSKVLAEAEEDAVKLAIAIAQRVLYRELSTDPEAILGLVKAAFQKLNARETHRLRISPPDLAVVEEHSARLQLPPKVEISADPSLSPGSAVFETSRGELDASIDTQIAEIGRGLADVMKRRTS